MIRIERLLFYPAVLAATVFLGRAAFTDPSPASFGGLAILGLIWVSTLFRVFLWFAKLAFWIMLLGGLGIWMWVSLGTASA